MLSSLSQFPCMLLIVIIVNYPVFDNQICCHAFPIHDKLYLLLRTLILFYIWSRPTPLQRLSITGVLRLHSSFWLASFEAAVSGDFLLGNNLLEQCPDCGLCKMFPSWLRFNFYYWLVSSPLMLLFLESAFGIIHLFSHCPFNLWSFAKQIYMGLGC